MIVYRNLDKKLADITIIEATPKEISKIMTMLGRKGGKIGGKNRAAKLSPEQRTSIALKAARARWDKKKSK